MVGRTFHPLRDIKALLIKGQYAFATAKCRNDVVALGLTQRQAATLVLALRGNDFRSKQPTCGSDFGSLDADDYKACFDPINWMRCQAGQGEEIYIKLAIRQSPTGDQVAVISFHRSANKGLRQ